jgi:hypothetical protein
MNQTDEMTEAEAAEMDRQARAAYESIGSRVMTEERFAEHLESYRPADVADDDDDDDEPFDAIGWAAIAPADMFDAEPDPIDELASVLPPDAPPEPRPHPAKFSDPILVELEDILCTYLPDGGKVLDPFAGVGRIHELRDRMPDVETWGVEIEREWAEQSPYTVTGDSRDLSSLKPLGPWDAIVTSPAYGNRMADSYDGRDGSKRYTYRIALGRPLSDANAGGVHWRHDKYRQLHSEVWAECARTVRPGGLVIINVSNFMKLDVEQLVVEWHTQSWLNLGFKLIEARRVVTARMKNGANRDARVDGEMLLVFEAPKT